MSPRRRTRIAARAKARPWVRLSDEQLLSKRFCDLRLSIRSSPLAAHVRRLYAELERRGIALRPHVWLAEDWFSPDGVPGIAVPFYLAHPRLERLERRIMREAEGGNTRLLLRILRHEAGHAPDNAYRLRPRQRPAGAFRTPPPPHSARYRARPPGPRPVPPGGRRPGCARAWARSSRRWRGRSASSATASKGSCASSSSAGSASTSTCTATAATPCVTRAGCSSGSQDFTPSARLRTCRYETTAHARRGAREPGASGESRRSQRQGNRGVAHRVRRHRDAP